jgi:hypothetical protein
MGRNKKTSKSLNLPIQIISLIASGGQGGFFEKPPPWTPRKTFV